MATLKQERNSSGVRVRDDVNMNVWVGSNSEAIPVWADYRNASRAEMDEIWLATRCLHQGFMLNCTYAKTSQITCITEDGSKRRMLGFGSGEMDNVQISFRKPITISNAISKDKEQFEDFQINAAKLLYHGKDFFALTQDGQIYASYWTSMPETYRYLAHNVKLEHCIDMLTRENNFTKDSGPISQYEIAAKAIREEKKLFSNDISTVEQRIGNRWEPIAPDDVRPGMEIRVNGEILPEKMSPHVVAVEYEDGQLTMVTDNAIITNNIEAQKAAQDIIELANHDAQRPISLQEYQNLLSEHADRFEALCECVQLRSEAALEELQTGDFLESELDDVDLCY